MASNKTKTTQYTSVIIQKCFYLFGFTASGKVVVWCECCCFCAVEKSYYVGDLFYISSD